MKVADRYLRRGRQGKLCIGLDIPITEMHPMDGKQGEELSQVKVSLLHSRPCLDFSFPSLICEHLTAPATVLHSGEQIFVRTLQ